jgi:hypothetical protein
MTVARLAISLDEDLAGAVREAAGAQPISTWLAEAARQRLRSEGLARVVQEWEEMEGAITAAELEKAERRERAALRRARKGR